MNFTRIKYYIIFSLLLLCNFSLFAQHDIALSTSSNLTVTQIGEESIFNITIANVNATNIEGLTVNIVIPTTLDYIEDNAPAGTTFSLNSGEWNIFNQLNNNTDSLSLKLTLSPNTEGIHFIISEVSEMTGFDFNSNVQNNDYFEDDIGIACITIPIEIGQNDTVQLAAPTQFAEGHQWFKKTNLGDVLVSTDAIFPAMESGSYSYSNIVYPCPVGTCCDIILVERPEPCSINTYADVICNNNTTLGNAEDDIFELNIYAIAAGDGFSESYTVSYNGEILNLGGTNYGENILLGHPDFIADGLTTFDLIIQDANDQDCQEQITITAPEECSSNNCNLYAKIKENNCCEECRSGNLGLKLAYWREEFKELSSANLARSKPSKFNGSPFDANTNSFNSTDGLYAGEPFGGFDYAFSSAGDYNYWDLDLVGFYNLEEIRIFTKENCCGGDANSYRIFVSNEPFNTTDYNQLLNDNSIDNYNVSLTNTSSPSILSNINTLGRFVRIYLEGSGEMQLIEVEVIGSGNENSSPYSYTWSDFEIGNIPNPRCLPPNVYTVIITDISTGCATTKNIIVE